MTKKDKTEKSAVEGAGTDVEVKNPPTLPKKKGKIDMSQYGAKPDEELVAHAVQGETQIRTSPGRVWFKTMTGPQWMLGFYPFLFINDGHVYMVDRELADDFEETDIVIADVRAIRTKDGDYMLIMMNTEGRGMGQQNSYPKSMSQILIEAETCWTRAATRKEGKKYIGIKANKDYPEPIMPKDITGIMDLIENALGERLINSRDHPVYKEYAINDRS